MREPEQYKDVPLVTVLKERTPVARCDHTCHICGGRITRGLRYRYFFVRDDEAIPPRAFSSYQHFYCPEP